MCLGDISLIGIACYLLDNVPVMFPDDQCIVSIIYHRIYFLHWKNEHYVLQLMTRVDPLKASGAPTGRTRTPAGLHNKGNKNVYIFDINREYFTPASLHDEGNKNERWAE